MKKKLAVLLTIIVLIVIAVLFMPKGSKGLKTQNPFTFTYDANEKAISALIINDDMATLLACSPFYAGAQPYSGLDTSEFDDARAQKVQEIISESDALADNAIAMKTDIEKMRTSVSDFLTVCIKNDPKAEKYVRESAKQILILYTKEAAIEAEYKSYIVDSRNAFTLSFVQYLKTAKAVQLGTLYLQDMNNLVVIAALGVEGTAKNGNPAIKKAGESLDQQMNEFDGLFKQMGDVVTGIQSIRYGMKQLSTADYYFASSAVVFMRNSIPKLKETAANLKANPYMDDKVVAFTKDYLNKFDKLSIQMQKYLDSVPKTQLLEISYGPVNNGFAWAGDESGNAPSPALIQARGNEALAKKITDGVSSIASKGADAVSAGWNGIKTVVHGAQSTLGVGLDVAGTGVANIARFPVGWYYGNTNKECWEDMQANSREIITNWNNNKSGAATMTTANQYINNVDDVGEWIASKGVEKTIGEGWVSWGTGKVARAVAGVFTGLGKGITLVGNRDAQASDYVIGAIEISSAAIGGSKLIIKGSQVPGILKGLGQTSWISAKGALNTFRSMIAGMEKAEAEAALKQVFKNGIGVFQGQLVTPWSLVGRVAIADAMKAAMAQANKALKAELANIINTGVKAGWTNFNQTLRDSLNDFLKKKFTLGIKSLASAVGENPAAFADTVIASWNENVLKEMVDQAMAEAPQPAELKGLWTGTTLITSVIVPEVSAKAKKEGCNMDKLKELNGKSIATSINFSGSPSGSGSASVTMQFQPGKGQPFTGRYTYNKGSISIKHSAKGASVGLDGKVQRMTQGYAMNGKTRIRYGGGGFSMSIDGNFDLTKPR